jgi:3-(3-hydroxy-phenyl)propionate hydroxylase
MRVEQDGDGVRVQAQGPDGTVDVRGAYLVGADGGHSVVRKSLGVQFEGFTYPERILVLGTTFDFTQVIPDLSLINYFSDPDNYAHMLRIPDLWRMSLPIKDDVSDETARTDAFIEQRLGPLMPGIKASQIPVRGVYHVHQRVAEHYRQGRVFLAGDAAHLNNPKGGMGLNGGLHDAHSLAGRLAQARQGDETALDGYEDQRRPEAIQAIHKQTEKNYKALKEGGSSGRTALFDEWRAIQADPERARKLLLDTSMINSLRRCGMLPQPA